MRISGGLPRLRIATHRTNPCRIADLSSLERSWRILKSMSHFVETPSALMDLGAHEAMVQSPLQFRTSYELLVGEVEEAL